MRRAAIVVLCAAAFAAPASASPTVRLAIVHVMRGCHVFATATKQLGASTTLTVAHGTRLELRITCPMDFDVAQTSGPALALPSRLYAGTSTTIVFAKRGFYAFTATNVQTPEQLGLQTMGPTNTLVLRIRVT